MEMNQVRPSYSPYAAALVFVKENDDSLRRVFEYRTMNKITKHLSTPLPRSDDMFDRLW